MLKPLERRGMNAHYEDVLADIHSRDERDSCREVAPLRAAADALTLDTSTLSPKEAIADAVRLVRDRLPVANER